MTLQEAAGRTDTMAQIDDMIATYQPAIVTENKPIAGSRATAIRSRTSGVPGGDSFSPTQSSATRSRTFAGASTRRVKPGTAMRATSWSAAPTPASRNGDDAMPPRRLRPRAAPPAGGIGQISHLATLLTARHES